MQIKLIQDDLVLQNQSGTQHMITACKTLLHFMLNQRQRRITRVHGLGTALSAILDHNYSVVVMCSPSITEPGATTFIKRVRGLDPPLSYIGSQLQCSCYVFT